MAASTLPSRPDTASGSQILPQGPSSAFSGSQCGSWAGVCRSDLLGSEQAGMRRALTRGRLSPNDTKGIRNATSRCDALHHRKVQAHVLSIDGGQCRAQPTPGQAQLLPHICLQRLHHSPSPSPCAQLRRWDRVSLLGQLCGDLDRTDGLILTFVRHHFDHFTSDRLGLFMPVCTAQPHLSRQTVDFDQRYQCVKVMIGLSFYFHIRDSRQPYAVPFINEQG